MKKILTAVFLLASLPLFAAQDEADKYPESLLFDKPVSVIEGVVWSSIGATAPPTYENAGHNNNLTFVVTNDGVVVINAGDNYLLAKALHAEVKKITGQPVKYVILENGQGHAMLGSNYWKEQGATIIAHEEAAHEIDEYGLTVLEQMQRGRKDRGVGTELVQPDVTFSDRYDLTLGGVDMQVLKIGPAHSPGDTQVYLPRHKLMIAGDIAFNVRMLPVFEHTDTKAWLETWKDFAAIDMEKIIPGHGGVTDLATVTRYTKDYLTYMRSEVAKLLDEGATLDDAGQIDQSAFRDWHTYDELHKLNAGRIFAHMEFE